LATARIAADRLTPNSRAAARIEDPDATNLCNRAARCTSMREA
jgi:hypothetical protein